MPTTEPLDRIVSTPPGTVLAVSDLHLGTQKVLSSLHNHWDGLTVFVERPEVVGEEPRHGVAGYRHVVVAADAAIGFADGRRVVGHAPTVARKSPADGL